MTRKAIPVEDLSDEEIALIAAAEVDHTDEWAEIARLPRNSALHRAGATVMRRNGFTEAEIVEAYGYSPDSIE